MRVALIAFKSLPTCIYAIQLANGLSEFAEVQLFIGHTAAEKYSKYVNSGVTLNAFHVYRHRDPRSLYMAINIIYKVKLLGCQIAHLIYPDPWFNLFIPFIRSFPLITTVHDVDPHVGDKRTNRLPRFFNDIATKYSSGLVVHGNKLKNDIRNQFAVKARNIFVIPHMNYSFYKHWDKCNVREEENNILFFGSIWEYKGLKYLMMAEQYLQTRLQHYKITIAGMGEDFSIYSKYIHDLDRYEIINEFIPDDKIPELFRKSSVVVLPYIEASQTGVVPLAFAFGKPVVCTNVGSIPELVDNGKNGFVVHPRDPEALADAICNILQDNGLKQAMSANAEAKAYIDLSWTRIGDMHLRAYETLLPESQC